MTGSTPRAAFDSPIGPRLGGYEILGRLGAGGMGEVYRARDTRLGREVALKILPEAFSSDADRTQRFTREARAASGLNHPNIVTIYEIGAEGARSYIAMECVEGKTLRELLANGPLPTRRLLDTAVQVASGLASAHEAGIVHRDLKPENVMVSRDGFAKILDFGLAKWLPFEGNAEVNEATLAAATEPGMVLGTVGYMSPEQAMGKRVDFRSDQFSFGSVLYEMATGKRAFQKETKPETLSAIIRGQPEPIVSLNPTAPAPLRWIVERCLAKEPEDRYVSTKDLARELATVRDHLSEAMGEALVAAPARRKLRLGAIVVTFALAAAALAFLAGRSTGKTSPPRFHQVTFRNQGISTARFAPDGRSVVYGAYSEGGPAELYSARPESPEVRSLALSGADLLSISSTAEMAVLVHKGLGPPRLPHIAFQVQRDRRLYYGTLARESLAGGALREILDGVWDADWTPDGKSLAAVHSVGGKIRLEFPIGTTLYELSSGWLNHLRVSPDGKHVAFTHGKTLKVVDQRGGTRSLADNAWETAWGPGGKEIWFSALLSTGTTEIRGVTLEGRERLISNLPGDFVLHDAASDGRLLLGRLFQTSEIIGTFPGEARERNLSWLERSVAADLSANGELLLFNEARTQQAEDIAMYVRRTDGSAAKRLADGWGWALSPDGQFVLGSLTSPSSGLQLIPTGAGQPKTLDLGKLVPGMCGFFPDGKRIFFIGSESGRAGRLYVMDLPDGKPRAISPEGVRLRRARLSGDGRFAAVVAPDNAWWLYPTEPGTPGKVAGLEPGEEPIRWSGDGKWLYVRGVDRLEPGDSLAVTRVYRLDPWSGKRQLWKEIPPATSAAGGGSIGTILFSSDGKICVYTHDRFSSALFVAEGLK